MEFWNSLLTEKSWVLLQELKRDYNYNYPKRNITTAYLLGLFPNLNVPENETLGIILEFKNKEGLLLIRQLRL